MSASPHVLTAGGNFVVVTQVISSPQGAGPNPPQGTKSRIQASVLGTLQIVMGLAFLVVQLAIVPCTRTLGLVSGAIVWGPLSFIVSGSLTVSTIRGSNRSLVRSSQFSSLFAACTSCAAIIISVLDAVFNFDHELTCCGSVTCWSVPQRLSVVLTIFCVTEYVAATMSYISQGHYRDQDQIITNHQPQEGAPERTGTLPTYEAPPTNTTPTNPPPPDNSYEMVKPDEYNTYVGENFV